MLFLAIDLHPKKPPIRSYLGIYRPLIFSTKTLMCSYHCVIRKLFKSSPNFSHKIAVGQREIYKSSAIIVLLMLLDQKISLPVHIHLEVDISSQTISLRVKTKQELRL